MYGGGSGLRDAKVGFGTAFLAMMGIALSAAYVAGALSQAEMVGLLAGVPVAVAGSVLVVLGYNRWSRTEGDSGGGLSALGALLVVGSIWAAIMTNNAIIA